MANPLLGWVAGASPQTLERLQSYRVPVDADPLAILRTLEKDCGRWPEVDADAASLRSLIRAELSDAVKLRESLAASQDRNAEEMEMRFAWRRRAEDAEMRVRELEREIETNAQTH